MSGPDPEGQARFEALLNEQPRARVSLAELWQIFSKAVPVRPQGREDREWLEAALARAADHGYLRLPPASSPAWDRAQNPPLPARVTLIRARVASRDDAWRRHPWHPQLAWVSEQQALTVDQVNFLLRVQEGLKSNRFAEPVPLKYRSLELTGNEKRLQALSGTSLFGPGRLSLGLLGCLPEWNPLAVEHVGSRASALVVENAGTFDVASRVLRALPGAPYGLVAFGGGMGVLRSLPRLLALRPETTTLHYLGDLDWAGLRIAVGAQALAAREGLPPLMPATGLHQAMLAEATALGAADGWPGTPTEDAPPPEEADRLLAWVPADVRLAAKRVLASGHRIPEEVLSPAAFRRSWQMLSGP